MLAMITYAMIVMTAGTMIVVMLTMLGLTMTMIVRTVSVMMTSRTIVTIVAEVVMMDVVIAVMTTEVIVVRSYIVMITTAVEAMNVVMTAVATVVRMVDVRHSVVIVRMVVIDLANTEKPASTRGVDRTIEVLECAEASKLRGRHDHTEVVVTPVEVFVVRIDGILIAIDDFVHHLVNSIDKVVIDLVAVLVLHVGEVEFVSHAVAQEACILTNGTARKR